MKKILTGIIILFMPVICFAESIVVMDSVNLSDKLDAATTTYILIDVTDSTNYSHTVVNSSTETLYADLRIERLEVNMSSNTAKVEIGQAYEVGQSTSNIRWIDRFYRNIGEGPLCVVKNYSDGSPLGPRNILKVTDAKIKKTNESIGYSNVREIYDFSNTANITEGDLIARVTGSGTAGDIFSIKVFYTIK